MAYCSVVWPHLSIGFTGITMGDSELDQLSTQLDVDVTVGDTFLHVVVDEKVEHPRISLYKNRGRAIDQERRWRQELEAIRRRTKRRGTFDLNRSLHLLEVDRPISEVEQALTNSHPWVSKPSKYCGASWRSYSKRLMLAEWLLFMPETFAKDYRMKLCPKGRHVLVFAAKGTTRVLSRTGGLILKTVSRLPGGGLGQSEYQNAIYCSMLDCIMLSAQVDSMQVSDGMTCVPRESTPTEFKVLDLIRFRGTSYTQLPVS
ncbi:snurportin-1 [Paragonimus westermani]|uniref:Snurportin-1 n=1 Tax=Paragonimus westermani TaxID=34504 RepID=A0A5J4N5W7_9TREM|nr:snurportin-1 [Paragonimus westermani]